MTESNTNEATEKLKEKALKITEALYRTTEIMFDGEPLKWSLRQSALEIMNIVSDLNSFGQINEINKLDKLIRNLFFKLELASSGTYISKMNFEVLKREYSLLQSNVIEQSKLPVLLDIPVSGVASPQYQTQKEVSDILSDSMKMTDMLVKELRKQETKHEIKIETKTADPDRKSVIVSALRDSGPSSVSDVAKVFNGTIGEKTVQRELNGLVEVGAIKKEGEKRWRRYFL